MAQNRNKLIDLFIGNLSNSIIHKILEKAIDDENIRRHYDKELNISLKIAKRYREKINPVNSALPDKDIDYIKLKITNKVKSELLIRISKGYKHINLDLIGEFIDEALKNMKILQIK